MSLILRNTDPRRRQLSFEIVRPVTPASPSLRRGVRNEPFSLPFGAEVDLCKRLACSAEEALRLLEASPDFIKLRKMGALHCEGQASAQELTRVVLQEPAPVSAPTPPTPPSEPTPKMAGMHPRTLGEAIDQAKGPVVAVVESPATDAVPVGAPPADAPPVDGTPTPPALDALPTIEIPSMNWPMHKLDEYAQARGIDTQGKSKTWILRALRGGG